MKRTCSVLVALFAVFALVTSASAVPLGPGETQTKPGFGLDLPNYDTMKPGFFVPDNVLDVQIHPFTGDFSGNLTTTVYENGPGGPLAFQYVFTNDHDSNELIRATLGSNQWAAGWVDILSAGADGSGSSTTNGNPNWTDGDPNFILRTIPGSLAFQWRETNIGTTLLDQDGSGTGLSSMIWVETTATAFQQIPVGLIDGGVVGQTIAKGPLHIEAIPEPGAMILLGGGLLGIAGVSRRRRTKK
jgi:hypothetical protein